jgi:Domain of unknown function (DUF6983)
VIIPFPQTIGQNLTFNPVLDGNTYQVTITWNIFGNRWYFNLYNLNGALVTCRALVSSDDQHSIESIVWDNGVVTVTASSPHFFGLGDVVNLNISGNTPIEYNGIYPCDVTGTTTFTYLLTNNPGQQVVIGNFGSIVDLTHGFFNTSTIAYYANSNQFVVSP